MKNSRSDSGDSSGAAGSRGAKIFGGASRGLGRREARAYQGVLEAVLCIPAGALLGYGVDRWLQTAPWGVLAGLGFGFIAFVLAAARLPGRLSALSAEEAAELAEEAPHNKGLNGK